MAYFIEVHDMDKKCPVIINLDTVMEIAPIINPTGCEITFIEQDDFEALRREKLSGGAMKGRRVMRVTNSYNEFKQFVIQKVSADDVAKLQERVEKANTKAGIKKEPAPVTLDSIPKL